MIHRVFKPILNDGRSSNSIDALDDKRWNNIIRLIFLLTLLFYVSLPAIMPKSYIVSKPPLDQSVEDWLKWTRSDFERKLSAISPTLTAIMGINKAGDIQYLFIPTIIPKAFAGDDEASIIIGNANDSHSKPSFIHTDTTDLGSVYVIDTYDIIPDEIHLEEPLPSKFLVDTSYAKAIVPIGMALNPFFGQHLIKGCIHDADFNDKMESISPIHLKWAKLFKEHIAQ